MAIEYGEAAFNLTSLKVASYTSPATYGSTITLEAGTQMNVEVQGENLQLDGYGGILEIASIVTHCTFTLEYGSLDFDALEVLAGVTESTAGTTPNQVTDIDIDDGGIGLPYVGALGDMAATLGNAAIGVAKAKLDTVPAMTIAQNEFLTKSVTGRGISDGTQIIRIRRNETSAASTTLGAFFT